MGFLKKFAALVKGMPDWHEKYNQDMGYLYEAFNDMESEAGRSIIPCSAAYDTTNKVHVLTPLNSSQTIPASGMIPVTFIPDADFHAGDKLRFNGQDCGAVYSNTDLAVADGAFRAGFVTSVVFQFAETGGGLTEPV